MQLNEYPPAAFSFKVIFGSSLSTEDTSFQEVSGISSNMETEDIKEGGVNSYVHKLPVRITHGDLELKRGIAPLKSPLVKWCKAVFESDLIEPISPQPVSVYLLDENQITLRAWAFNDAYPVKWEVEGFNSSESKVAIEKIVLRYANCIRIV